MNRALEFRERLLRHRCDHVREGCTVLGRIGLSETLQRAMQIAEFVRREVPVFVLCGLPKSAMARLNRRDHQIADARQIGSGDAGDASGAAASPCEPAKAIPGMTVAGIAKSVKMIERRRADMFMIQTRF